MSKIAKLILAQKNFPSEHATSIPKFNYAKVTENTSRGFVDFENHIKYSIGVYLGAQIYIREGNDIVRAEGAVRRAVVEEIFGEFRPLFNDIIVSLYDRDYDKIKALIESLYDQMFTDKIKD